MYVFIVLGVFIFVSLYTFNPIILSLLFLSNVFISYKLVQYSWTLVLKTLSLKDENVILSTETYSVKIEKNNK